MIIIAERVPKLVPQERHVMIVPLLFLYLPIVLEILLILEDRIEIIHALSGQKTYVTDDAGNTAYSERSTTKSDEDDFITRSVVGRYKGVHLTDVLKKN